MKRTMSKAEARVTAALALVGGMAFVAAGLPIGDGPDRAGAAGEAAEAVVTAPAAVPSTVAAGTSAGERPENAATPAAVDADRRSAAAAEAAVLATEVGEASYYANLLAGRPTASGVPYDPSAAVAAHRTLPFGTRLRVHNLSNGRVVEVEVVDRGPFAKGRVLDLSRSAAERLDFIRQGHTRVRIEILEYGEGRRRG